MEPTKTLHQLIIDELGISHISPEAQEKILANLTEAVLKKIVLAVIEDFSPEEQRDFDAVAESGNSDIMTEYLKIKVPHYDRLVGEKVKETVHEFKKIREEM